MEYEIKIKLDNGKVIELTAKEASELHGILDRLYGRHEYTPVVPYHPHPTWPTYPSTPCPDNPWIWTTTSTNEYTAVLEN
jgi:hypothetical protein